MNNKNSLVNFLNVSELTVNSIINPFSSTFHHSSSRVLNQNKILSFKQFNYGRTGIKKIRCENKSLITGVKLADTKCKLLKDK